MEGAKGTTDLTTIPNLLDARGHEIEIVDRLIGINTLSTDTGADESRPGRSKSKIEGLKPVIAGNQNTRIFDAGVEHAIHEACNARMRGHGTRDLAFEKKFIARSVCSKGKHAAKTIGDFIG